MMNQICKLEPATPGNQDRISFPPVVTFPDSGTWFNAIDGERLSIRVHSSEVNGRYTILESIAAPGTATPMHYHTEDEIFQVLEGIMTFSLARRSFQAGAGSTVVIPAGAHHAWKNRSGGPVRMLAILFPGGLEDMFPRLAGLAPDGIVSLAASYGTHVVGPPIEG